MRTINSEVFNGMIGTPYDMGFPQYSVQEEDALLASLFEQLMIFDRITISINRFNYPLILLIKRLGINVVERLVDTGYIKFLMWTPVLVTSSGRQKPDGSIDKSVIYGQPPIVAGSYSDTDLDPERNVEAALSHFGFHRDRVRTFTKKATGIYSVPKGMEYSTNAAQLVIDAYKNNNLAGLNLPYSKEPDQLDPDERFQLLGLGHKVIETALLSKYGLKSFEDYSHYEICKQNLENIGNAFNVRQNSAALLNLENVPDLKTLYLDRKLDFEDVFKLRYLSTAKYYRKWINSIGETADVNQVTAEYIKEIKGKTKFFGSTYPSHEVHIVQA